MDSGALEITTNEVFGRVDSQLSDALQELHCVLEAKWQCSLETRWPASLTRQIVWESFRTAVLGTDYYLHHLELLCVAACFQVTLSVHQYHRNAAPGASNLDLLGSVVGSGNGRHAHVALEVGAAQGSGRGHFTRLFPLADWEEHHHRLGALGDRFSDTTLTSSETSSETGDAKAKLQRLRRSRS